MTSQFDDETDENLSTLPCLPRPDDKHTTTASVGVLCNPNILHLEG
ncbi:unnamed protein product [Schistosoma curassoni]|uniref:Uncharacterized protein n=1 Tax=Schistosoma curassoni TaxID=6186 RepID=A0A183KFT3_9TREM|nr:unnamed protein product [Schistosoma curassoni]